MTEDQIQEKLHLLALQAAKILYNCKGGNFDNFPKLANFDKYLNIEGKYNFDYRQSGGLVYVNKSHFKYSVRRLSFAYLIPLAQYIYSLRPSSVEFSGVAPEAPLGVPCAIAAYKDVTCRLVACEVLHSEIPKNVKLKGHIAEKFYHVPTDELLYNVRVVYALRLDVSFRRRFK